MLCLFCAGINLALARSEILIRSVVSASTGRTFTDDTENPRIKITILRAVTDAEFIVVYFCREQGAETGA